MVKSLYSQIDSYGDFSDDAFYNIRMFRKLAQSQQFSKG